MTDGGAPALPISALLSQTLVALTIDLDNEFERRMPHRTTTGGTSQGTKGGAWLTSVAMWASCLRYVDDDGIAPADLVRLARTHTNLHGMQRWKYVVLGDDGKLRPTAMGRNARDLWPAVFAVIKERWRERFGPAAIDELRAALGSIVDRLDPGLPDFMPILGYGLSTSRAIAAWPDAARVAAVDLPLPALLSKLLIALALAYESKAKLSLAIAANAVRLLDADAGVRVRDLPRRAGVSKEAIAMALGFLERHGYATLGHEAAGSRVKVAIPTDRGKRARAGYAKLLEAIETDRSEWFGTETIDRLRAALERLVVPRGRARSELFDCIAPRPESWRAKLPAPAELPHFPMVLHRGGFPDGS